MEKKTHSPQTYMRVAGNRNSRDLLAQVVYWNSRMRVKKQGHLWIAKTREEWYAETGLTRWTFDQAHKNLAALGLIESRSMLFNKLRTLHIRLIPARLETRGR